MVALQALFVAGDAHAALIPARFEMPALATLREVETEFTHAHFSSEDVVIEVCAVAAGSLEVGQHRAERLLGRALHHGRLLSSPVDLSFLAP